MNLVGQCPACHTQCEVDPDDVGYALECECGADLFACSVSGFDQFNLYCSECGTVHPVDRNFAGDTVDCECGKQIRIPTILLRVPVSFSDGKDRGRQTRPSAQSSTDRGSPVVACPACRKEYGVARDDLDQDCRCDCGCIFRTSIEEDPNGSRKLVARVSPGAPVRDGVSQRAAQQAGPSDQSDEQPPARKKQRSWFAILGTASVVSFLLMSVGVFLTRDTGAQPKPGSESTAARYVTPPDSEVYSSDAMREAIKELGGDAVGANRGLPRAVLARSQTNHQADTSSSEDAADSKGDGKPAATLRLPPLAPRPLPKATPPRERVPLSPVTDRGLTFVKAYEVAFADFRETRDAKHSADESKDPDQLAAFRRRIGTTIGLLQHTHDVGMQLRPDEEFTEEEKEKKLTELRYFLTWAYFQAGWLPEAAIMGEAVARWGAIGEPATQEAAMFALAAAQEASATQWGLAQRVGELERMEKVATIIANRWPNHRQLEAIWMNLASLYDAFGQPKQAARTYARLPEDSASYVTAQLAAGNACWTGYRRQLSGEGEPSAKLRSLRDSARVHFVAAVDRMHSEAKVKLNELSIAQDAAPEKKPDDEAEEKKRKKKAKGKPRERRSKKSDDPAEHVPVVKPTRELLDAKLSLARIDVLSGNLDEASRWLTAEPFPLTKSVAVGSSGESQIVMPETFVKAVFETQFAVKTQMNDPAGAKAALQQMTELLGASGGAVGGKMLRVAVDYVRELKSSPTVVEKQVKTLEDLLLPLRKNPDDLTADNLLWISQSWSEIAERTRSPNLAITCYSKAADELGRAMRKKGFPKASLTSARLRQAQLLREAGNLQASLAVIEDVLKETPNIFQLQMEAATAVEQLAIEEVNPQGVADAVDGPSGSAIWGWSKLVSALHGIRYSSSGTEQHARQLLQCQYHLAKCRWLLAKATVNPSDRSRSMASVSKTLNRLVMTTSEDQEPWSGRFKRLHSLAVQ